MYFVGIGGAGMSALARFYKKKGYEVLGSDSQLSMLTEELIAEGIPVSYKELKKNITRDIDLVIYTAAAREEHPERVEAKRRRIKSILFAQAMGDLTKQYITIAVSGTHGKSTTTSLLAAIFIEAGLDPSVIVGTQTRELEGKNFRAGKSRYLIIEADEYDRTFHNYQPAVTLITNIDADHLDTYRDLAGVIKGFTQYFQGMGEGARIFVNGKDANSLKAAKPQSIKARVVKYNNKAFSKWPLKIKGQYNQVNAEGAWQVAKFFGVEKSDARRAMKAYEGSFRRMEELTPKDSSFCKRQKLIFYTDYAHHPTEIAATLTAIKEKYPKKKVIVMYEAHQRARLTLLFSDFIKAFRGYTEVWLLPEYQVKGREETSGKSAWDLYNKLTKAQKGVEWLETVEDGIQKLEKEKVKDSVVVFMGAGAIDNKIRSYFKSLLF